MPAEVQQKRPTVFISYAHESDALRASVKALADWLGNHGCTVLADHPYVHRPPERGWQVWMHDCVRNADVVLVVCTPKLKARYEKNEEPGTGFGAIFEGAIVTQHIYDAAMRNTKFFPIIPDGGSYDDVPTTLRPWWNRHSFPSGNEGIRCMIFNEPTDGLSQSDTDADHSGWGPESQHQQLAARLLGATGADSFVAALKAGLIEAFSLDSAPQTPTDIVRWFIQSTTEGEEIELLFDAVHAALIRLEEAVKPDVPTRRDIEEAAAAMYCLAACLSVDRAAHNAGEFVIRVPRTESIICAVIATALFGGELRLRPTEDAELPGVEYVLSVPLPPTGPRAEEDFERNAYIALFWGHRKGPQEALDSGPLSEDQRQALIVRLRKIRKREKRSLALVVRGMVDGEPFRRFAEGYQVPVMVPGDEAATALFRIPAARLRAHISEFWATFMCFADQALNPMPLHPRPEEVNRCLRQASTFTFTGMAPLAPGLIP